MKIVNIVPGFGGTFYCGNCLRDSVMVKTMKDRGHDAITLPVYLPLTMEDDPNETEMPVFYGAVNIYLKQNYKMFRHMPGWLEKFFNSQPILKYAAKKAGSTRAGGLESMTISMLKGADGFQKAELQQLIDFLRDHEKPDMVHLSNALLTGLAGKIKEELNIPVVCTLQDEDVWVDAMDEPHRQRIWDLLHENIANVDVFVAVSHYFGGIMQKKMNIPDEKLEVVRIGVDPERYHVNVPDTETPAIGYLSRMSKSNGLEILIDAFIQLKDQSRFKNLRLRLSGGMTGDDKPFIRKQVKKLKKKNYLKDVEFVDNYSGEHLLSFFQSMTVLSVPVLKGEAFGLYQLEALASGIPLVQPALGAFPEVIEATGGGAIYKPNTAEALASKLEEVLSNSENLMHMSRMGREATEGDFSSYAVINNMTEVYNKIINKE